MRYKTAAAAALAAVMLLGGCGQPENGGTAGLRAQLGLYEQKYEQACEENTELREKLAKAESDKESADELLNAQIHDLEQENAKLESEISELNNNINESSYYKSVIYKGGGYTLRYLGDECDDEGRTVLVLCLQGAYIPYIRVDTKAAELVSGIMVRNGTYEFANESIDENGYLYLISPIVEEDYLPFKAEKYIKLRFIDAETGQYTMFDKALYNDGYTHNVDFNGNIVISDTIADTDGSVRYYNEGTVLNVLGGSPLVLFDEEQTE